MPDKPYVFQPYIPGSITPAQRADSASLLRKTFGTGPPSPGTVPPSFDAGNRVDPRGSTDLATQLLGQEAPNLWKNDRWTRGPGGGVHVQNEDIPNGPLGRMAYAEPEWNNIHVDYKDPDSNMPMSVLRQLDVLKHEGGHLLGATDDVGQPRTSLSAYDIGNAAEDMHRDIELPNPTGQIDPRLVGLRGARPR